MPKFLITQTCKYTETLEIEAVNEMEAKVAVLNDDHSLEWDRNYDDVVIEQVIREI